MIDSSSLLVFVEASGGGHLAGQSIDRLIALPTTDLALSQAVLESNQDQSNISIPRAVQVRRRWTCRTPSAAVRRRWLAPLECARSIDPNQTPKRAPPTAAAGAHAREERGDKRDARMCTWCGSVVVVMSEGKRSDSPAGPCRRKYERNEVMFGAGSLSSPSPYQNNSPAFPFPRGIPGRSVCLSLSRYSLTL